jgi:O-acetyl-ADP-ribose deacetylase
VDITVVRGDITTQEVDAVVNAANTELRGGGGVDGAIHRAGGPAILADCIARYPSGLATGQAGWTTAGNLPAQWVIHVVGPLYTGEDAAKRHQLSSCYTNALHVADELGAATLAFPLVSAGVYGWPIDDAATAAVQALRSVSTEVAEARMVAFSAPAYDALNHALAAAAG